MGDRALATELGWKGIDDPQVREAIASLSRADFVPADLIGEASLDEALPIGEGQTISQPYVVALMTQALALRPGARVLEIGTGSGYQAAVLSALGAEVYSIEILPELAEAARARLERLRIPRVQVRTGNGHLGWPEAAPFDGILVTAAPEHIPFHLADQLRPGGVLVAPIGPQGDGQDLVRVRKRADGTLDTERLLAVLFVPMTGQPPA